MRADHASAPPACFLRLKASCKRVDWANPPRWIYLIEVELGNLKKVGDEIRRLLSHRLKAELVLKGKVLMVPDEAAGRRLKVKAVKMELKHVLHQMGLSKDYRVLADDHGIRIVKVAERMRAPGKEGVVPSPSQTLPYLFPG